MVLCPNCGQENPEGFRLCGMCGAALAEAIPPAAEERKVVSVLFVDLVGFTDRSDRADPEDVRATLRPYHARVKREIERFGGTVEKFVGDAVMAVFGAPVAHEDDAERAVRASLRILEAIRELNEAQPDLELSVRAAVNTGEAVVSLVARPEEGEGIVAGDVVNTASRLQQVAPVGGVVVGEITYRATKDIIDYEGLEPVSVKGKAEPVPIWRARAARSRFGVDVEQPAATPFVGREDELALLKQTYGRTVREAGIQLVTVTGEPGVGKSRLVGEFRAFLDEQPELVFWRQGRCLPYGEGITFWALGEIVKAQAGILESDGPEQATDKLEVAVQAMVEEPTDREWLKTRLAPLVGLSVPEETEAVAQAELFTAWRRFLEAVASSRPLVVVFEDLHWADPPLLQFVEHVVDWSVEVPLLVLCTARPELYERQSGWGGGKRNSTTIALSPLSSEETARLISALLSQAVLPAETQAALLERSGGNPLYAEEFARMLIDRGILERRGRALRIAEDVEIPVPETVQALIAGRLDTLAAERKSLLHDAAVVGKVFWAGTLAAMEGLDERTVEEGLHELARKELVRPARVSSVSDQAEYSFWHLLVRDVAYGQIPRAARARKHRAAAEWIERIAEDRVTDHAELLAHHYGQALELARAAGAADEASELEDPTSRFLVMAGDRAMRLDLARAEAYYRQALELLPPGHPERPKALVKFTNAAGLAGRLSFDEAERNYEEAIAEFQAQNNRLGAGEAMVRLSLPLHVRGETARAHAVLHEAVELLEREPPGPELASAYTATAGRYMLSGPPQECLDWSEKALALDEELGIEELIVRALQFRGIARCELGDLGGLDDLRESLRLSLEVGLGHETALCHTNLADWVWLTESPATGLKIHHAGIAFGERRGINTIWSRAETCWMLYDLGEWDELLRIGDDVIERDRAQGGSQPGVMAASYKAQVLARRGEAGEAASLQEDFLPRAREIRDPQVLVPALAIAALIEQARGDLSAALRLVEELDEATRDRPNFLAENVLNPLRVCVAAGALGLAESMVERASDTTARQQYAVLTGRATLAEAQGNLARALELYEEAAERWSDYGFVLERGQALLGEGRCLLGLGRSGEATTRVEEAGGVFQGLRARPLVAEAGDWLQRAVAVSS